MNLRISNEIITHRIIKKYGLQIKKNYGQNFIINPKVVEHIVEFSNIDKNDIVIEIGPGIGSLTEGLLTKAYQVIAYEIDKDLEKILTNELCFSNFELVMKDFLKVDLFSKIESLPKDKNIVIVSNLPYYITSDILIKIVTSNIKFKSITTMMQKEVADKFISNKGKKDESPLTYISRYYFDCHELLEVSKDNFYPKPNVESTVIMFTPIEYPLKVKDDKKFIETCKALLKMRRKTIQNNLNSYLPSKEMVMEVLEECNILPNTRAESLKLDDFIKISNVIYEKTLK